MKLNERHICDHHGEKIKKNKFKSSQNHEGLINSLD